jgi:hypothetical protein
MAEVNRYARCVTQTDGFQTIHAVISTRGKAGIRDTQHSTDMQASTYTNVDYDDEN